MSRRIIVPSHRILSPPSKAHGSTRASRDICDGLIINQFSVVYGKYILTVHLI